MLPEQFLQRYLKHRDNKEFVEASQLFVPISNKKLQYLRSRGKVQPLEDKLGKQWLVKQPYNSELGLCFDPFSTMPNDEL